MHRVLAFVVLVSLVMLAPRGARAEEPQTPREALKSFNELVGPWRGVGNPEGGSARDKQKGFWKETITWSWKFQGEDAWVVMTIEGGKHFNQGELRWSPKTKAYTLIMTTTGGEKQEFEAKLLGTDGRKVEAVRVDAKSKESVKLTIERIGEIRFKYVVARAPAGRRFFTPEFTVGATKEGESLAQSAKSTKPECIVSGGLGTFTVSYQGKSYYVCCSGCRDEFNANPAKYVKEWEEKQKAGK